MRDFDGDTDGAGLRFNVDNLDDSVLIVGNNVDDVDGETTPWVVGGGAGEIVGGNNTDILVGDVGGATLVGRDQDYNFVYILDTSGSMGVNVPNDCATSRVEILIAAVKSQMLQFHNYQNGHIKVHIVDFGSD